MLDLKEKTQYFFTTETGSDYILKVTDSENMTLTRTLQGNESLELRKDNKELPVLSVFSFEENSPGVFIIDVVQDDKTVTIRRTSTIQSITQEAFNE